MCAAACLFAFLVQGAEQQPAIVDSYKVVWEKSKDSIDVAMVNRLVAELQSEDADVRRQAIGQLVATTGCDLGFDPAADQERREFAAKAWQRYATGLRTAVDERVPVLLQAPSTRNEDKRGRAAEALGRRTPHPAFLGLLTEVVKNEHEPRYVRYWALTSISQIPHEGVIEFLIGQLSTDLAFRSWEQLDKLTAAGIYNETKDWREVKQRYQDWWAHHRETFGYQRRRVLEEH